jgi:hypothetical protein
LTVTELRIDPPVAAADRIAADTVGGRGKPVRFRRGPATVTGDARRERKRCAATGTPTASREGAAR